ncbi:hypothetical protein EW146_g3331 [Bondarzewia mesenterica]|uniref:Uncharacterized protein n=1 Tax=Bondarzewia mesenterica TaxID=1095465 RepID=A0A4S4LXW2_9AGAM|nr:hypothetical protein EW146_g3331 [Bondarzewia mesenterica]
MTNRQRFHLPLPAHQIHRLQTPIAGCSIACQEAKKIDTGEGYIRSPSPLTLPLPLKKVKTHINLSTNGSETSLIRTPDSAGHPSQDTARPPQDSVRMPNTPVDSKFGSIRSILRDRNTPGSGQSVRFFSRDAYKVISPDVSAASEPEDLPFMERLQNVTGDSTAEISCTRPRSRPSVQEMFSSAKASSTPLSHATPADPIKSITSITVPISPPDLSNIFDLSHDHDLPTIPANAGVTLLNSAVEIFEDDNSREDHPSKTGYHIAASPDSLAKSEDPSVYYSTEKSPAHDRSLSFSFGQKVFSPMLKPSPDQLSVTTPAADIARPPSRNRSMSDTLFHSMRPSKQPEADINDVSTSSLVVYSTLAADRPEPDPFRANATTYYTPGAVIPPTPPQGTHSRKVSREEDEIFSLRTQLALQQEMCAQYELDLAARDELVNTLNLRLDSIEKDGEKRKSLLRGWKKKVQELERMCRHLEEEVENSRQESFERSIMDEASGEALRQLHKHISDLERERGDILKKGDEWKEEKERQEKLLREREKQLTELRDEMSQREQGETRLKEGIRTVQKQIEETGLAEGEEELRAAVMQTQRLNEEGRERHCLTKFEWDEERTRLMTTTDMAQQAKEALEAELDKARGTIVSKDEEMAVLKAELEAQWKNTEDTGERVHELKRERDTLQNELVSLEEKMEGMEVDWTDSENRRVELEDEVHEAWAARDGLDRERYQLEEELRAEQEHAEQLTQALQEREDRVTSLQQELKYSNETIARLDQRVQQRDADVEELAHKVVAREDETEEVREQMSTLKREYARAVDEQRRAVTDLSVLESGAREQLETAIRDKAEAEIAANTMRDRVAALESELERLRKQVHDLKSESADKEVRLVQMKKQSDRHSDDLQGLNIALDSKQQELELLKRRLGVKGTAGTTSAPSKVAQHRRESLSSFITPTVSRPSSRLSGGGGDMARTGRLSEAPSTVKTSMLGKSVRANGSASTTPVTSGTASTPSTVKPIRSIDGSMGPPPAKPRMSAPAPIPSHPRIPSSSVSRSSTKAGQSSAPTVSHPRRASSAMASEISRTARPSTVPNRNVASPILNEQEKENLEPKDKQRSLVAA